MERSWATLPRSEQCAATRQPPYHGGKVHQQAFIKSPPETKQNLQILQLCSKRNFVFVISGIISSEQLHFESCSEWKKQDALETEASGQKAQVPTEEVPECDGKSRSLHPSNNLSATISAIFSHSDSMSLTEIDYLPAMLTVAV